LLPIYFSSVAGAILGALLVRNGLNTVLWTGAAISLVAALLTTRLPTPDRRA
jgi:predicted MFS family arabinose efflux permease